MNLMRTVFRKVGLGALGAFFIAVLLIFVVVAPAAYADLKPQISSFVPTSGPVDTTVTLSGSNFTDAKWVKFNGVLALFSVDSDTQITSTVPTGAATGPIKVRNPAGIGTSAANFVVTAPPSIASFTPISGAVGRAVILKGSNFMGATAVTFNSLASTFRVDSGSQISATVPMGATTGPVSVTTAGGAATATSVFTVVHKRNVSIRLHGKLLARGRLRVTDGYSPCKQKLPVQIQRRRSGPWHTVARRTTDVLGMYQARLRATANKSRFRARAPKRHLKSGDVCGLAASTRHASGPGPNPNPSPSPSPAPFPSGAGTVWGIFSDSRNGLTGEQMIQWLEGQIGRTFSGQRVYSAMDARIPNAVDQLMQSEGKLDYHNMNSWHVDHGDKICYPWAGIAAGDFDGLLRDQAKSVAAWGYPVFMSFTHEPSVNSSSHPLCGTSDEYRAAYDHVVSIFAEQGASNVIWVWTPTAKTFSGAEGGPEAWEPSHYDVVGVDGYNRAGSFKTPEDIFQAAHDFAVSRGKPMLIGEIGCDELPGNPGAKADWITEAAAMFKSWGNVKAIMWTNASGDGEWWLDSSPQALAAFTAAGHDPYFL